MGKIRKPRKRDILAEQQAPAGVPSQDQPTAEQVSAEIDSLQQVTLAPKKRVWEVDFLRGFMILFVIWDHFMWDVNNIVGNYNTGFFQWLNEVACNYYGSAPNTLRRITHDTFVTMFVLTSGVSCSFSNSNGKRAIKMMCFALLLSAVTFAASSVVGFNLTINFNVIHVIALSVFVWAGLELLSSKFTKDWQRNLYGWLMFALIITVLIVGYSARKVPWTSESKIWFFLVPHTGSDFAHFSGGDYLSFFPDFGWFLLGAFLGKKLYKEKTTLFPTFNAKWVSPITFVGKRSIWVYFISQIVMYGFFYLFGVVLKIL